MKHWRPSFGRAPRRTGGGGKRRSFRRHQFGARQWDRDDGHKLLQTKVLEMELTALVLALQCAS
jgi:hypothetical protein